MKQIHLHTNWIKVCKMTIYYNRKQQLEKKVELVSQVSDSKVGRTSSLNLWMCPWKEKLCGACRGCVCRAKCHRDVWNTTLWLLTHPQRSHWLWQVAWRCQEIVISFIMWKLSTALRCALCSLSEGTSWEILLRRSLTLPDFLWFKLRLLRQDRVPHVQVRGQSEIAQDGQRAAQDRVLSSGGRHLWIKGQHHCFSYLTSQTSVWRMSHLHPRSRNIPRDKLYG